MYHHVLFNTSPYINSPLQSLLHVTQKQLPFQKEEQLEEERTCIICRDEMTVETARRLPGCGHM